MNKFKLNFSRFEGDSVVTGEAIVKVGLDDTGMSATAKRVEATYDLVGKSAETNASKNEKFAKSVSSVKTSLKTVKADLVGSFNANLGGLRDSLTSDKTSPKTKARIATFLGKTKTKGLDNLRVSQSNFLTSKDTNSVMSMNAQAAGLLNTAQNEQASYYVNLQKDALKTLEQRAKVELQLQKVQKSGGASAIQTLNAQATATDKLRDALDRLKNKSEESKNKFKSFIDKLKSVAVTWRIVSGFLGGIINTFAKMYDSAASYEEALNLYRTSFGEFASQADTWAERISTALYLDPKDVMQYAGSFFNLTKGLGASADAAYLMSTNLTQLSYDMSSYLNIDVESAQAKIQSAITGQSRAVASAGVAMQQATLQELAYSLGIKKSVSEMTQAEKTYLRYIQIMRSTKNMQMDLGKTIITPENALRVIRAQFVMLGRAIGQVFIPIVMAAIPYVMLLTQALQRLATWLGKKLGYEIAPVDYSNFKTGSILMDDLGDSADKTADKLGKVGKAAKSVSRSLAPFDELNVVESESSGGTGGTGGGAGAGIGGGGISDLEPFLEGYDMLGKLTNDFNDKLDNARENMKKWLPIIEAIGLGFLGWKLTKKFMENYVKVSDFMKSAKPIKEIITSPAAQGVMTAAGIVAYLFAQFKSVNDETDRFKQAWESGDWEEYFKIDSLDELIDKIHTVIFILQGGLPAAIAIAGNKLGWFDDLGNKVKDTFGKLKDFLVKDVFAPIGDEIKNIYDDNIEPTINDVKELYDDILKPVLDDLHNILKTIDDAVIDVTIKSGLLGSAFKVAGELIKNNFINTIKNELMPGIELTRTRIEVFISKIRSITGVFRGVTETLKGIKNGDWSTVWDGIKKTVVNAFKAMITPIAGAVLLILTALETMINAFIGALQGVVQAINKIKIKIPDWVPKYGGKEFSPDLKEPKKISLGTEALKSFLRLKTGMDFVPKDYFGPVYLDYGERVLTKEENKEYMRGNTNYISNLTRNSATTNNNQLVNDLARAIVDSMKLAEANRQPGITQVYIGNEKVYEGQGQYQNRQADRWGTNYIKI